MFDIHPTTTLISRVSHDTIDEEYRIPTQKEIKPGVTFKLEGMSYNSLGKPVPYYYFHTFPTKELSLVQYSNEFFKIWNKIQEGKAWIKNVFLHRIGDKVTHKEDPESIGIIKGRLPANTNYPKTKPYDNFIPNQYSITWKKFSENSGLPYIHWFDEDSLINKTRLEALPMKIKKPNRKKISVQYKIYSPKEWLDEKVKEGRDRAVYLTLLQQYNRNGDFGWLTKTTNIIIGKNINDELNAVTNHLKHYTLRKTNFKKNVKDIKILNSEDIFINKYHKNTNKYHKNTKLIKSVPAKQNKLKLKRVKFITTGEIVSMPEDRAMFLTSRDHGLYVYATKTEWREYIKSQKPEPKLQEIGKEEKTGLPFNRRMRRLVKQKNHKGSRLIKEQFVPITIPEEEIEVNSMSPCLNVYDDEDPGHVIGKEYVNFKYIRKAYTAVKRILVRVSPGQQIKLTNDIKLQRQEQSAKDHMAYCAKKNFKTLDELKEEFKSDERRNNKFSTTEKWSKTFDEIATLVRTGKYIENGKYKATVHKNNIFSIVSNIIREHNYMQWSDEKIKDFIRYLRLTTHKVFYGNKELKSKKSKSLVAFEPIQFATRVDHSKLKKDPETGKTIVEDGAFTEVPVKFKRLGHPVKDARNKNTRNKNVT
jgi:hypothetical protein